MRSADPTAILELQRRIRELEARLETGDNILNLQEAEKAEFCERIRELEAINRCLLDKETGYQLQVSGYAKRAEKAEAQALAWEADADAAHATMDTAWKAKERAEAELARVRAVVTCAAEDLEARASPEGDCTARSLCRIAKDLRAALEGKG